MKLPLVFGMDPSLLSLSGSWRVWIIFWYTYTTPLPPKQSSPILRGLHIDQTTLKTAKKAWLGKIRSLSWCSWWRWTLPHDFPPLATSSRWFWPFKVVHFNLPGPRYEADLAENYTIWMANLIVLGTHFSLLWRQKGWNPKKHPFPWNCHFAGLLMGTKISKFRLV